MTLRLGELFAGYGGLGLAVEEVFGAELAWVSEWEAAPSKILAHHWPNVPNYGDVTRIDWANIEPVDIISGGSPCQDLSLAGKRRGMTDGTRSNLWESMREGIATIRPRYVVWENVRGALSAEATSASDVEQREGFLGERRGHLRALGRVLGDLADLGYDCQWRGLRAADVGAPHGRLRIFVLATHRDHIGIHGTGQRPEQDRRGQSAHSRGATANTAGSHAKRVQGGCGEAVNETGNGSWEAPHAIHGKPESGGRDSATAVAGRAGPQARHHQEGTSPSKRHGRTSADADWGKYAGAVRRWEAMRGAAPSPVEMSPTGKPRLSAPFTEWMMGLPTGWITDVPGVSWCDQLKACGNGVVPQQAVAALRDMLATFQNQEIPA